MPAIFDPCAVIPVFDHERAVGQVVDGVRKIGLSCILVDDGSGPACAAELAKISARDLDVALIRLPNNSGKGAAVEAGLRAAHRAGRTHALQVDADGQHDIADAHRFLDEARIHRDSLVCGRPIFDAGVPKSRLYGRYLTHVMVWLNTLSLDVPDSMCGYRVYPLGPVMRLLDSVQMGSFMDFDIEVLVRLHWRGQRMRWLDTHVTYPADGISHIRVWHDNLRITEMHTRLFVGMLMRLPQLLWRKMA